MFRKNSVWLSMLLIALLVVACAAPSVSPLTSGGRGEEAAPMQPSKGTAVDTYAGTPGEDRMIVRTASLTLVVSDTEVSTTHIKSIVAALGGYVVDSNLWRDTGQLRGTVTVRVPAESLDDAISQFKGLAVKVERESGSSQDVTEQYSDLSAQLRNLEATEKELLELLTTVREKTGKAEDILAVHRELTQIRGQIEQLKGRMQYLERTSEMSAVTIELIPDVLAQPIAGTGWRPGEAVSGALRALLGTLRFLVEAAIWVVLYILPAAAVFLLPVVGLWTLWRRRKKAKPEVKA
jgi:hypothetical protein